MGLRKGQTNNPNGRPLGIRNKITTEIKEVVSGILKKKFTPVRINSDLKKLEPRQRLDVLIKLLSYVLPRPTEGTIQLDIGLENLSDEELDRVIQEILNTNNHEKIKSVN